MEDFKQTIQIKAGPDGNFSGDVSGEFPQGAYRFDLTTSEGSGFTTLYLVDDPIAVDNFVTADKNIENPVPSFWLWLIVALLVIVALYASRVTYFLKEEYEEDDELTEKGIIPEEDHSEFNYLLRGFGLSLIIVFIVFFAPKIFNGPFEGRTLAVDKLQGVVVAPQEYNPIEDVLLSVGEHNLVTSDSGRFVFTDLSGLNLLEIKDEGLASTIGFSVDEDLVSQIIYDLELFNTLVRITQFESYGQVNLIYGRYLDEGVKNGVEEEGFVGSYESHFSRKDTVNQVLEVVDMRDERNYYHKDSDSKHPYVVFVTVQGSLGKGTYIMSVSENGAWSLVGKQ